MSKDVQRSVNLYNGHTKATHGQVPIYGNKGSSREIFCHSYDDMAVGTVRKAPERTAGGASRKTFHSEGAEIKKGGSRPEEVLPTALTCVTRLQVYWSRAVGAI